MREALRRFAWLISVIALIAILINFNIKVINNVNSIYGDHGYVSDECWYVEAARNILHKVFGLSPIMWGSKVNVTLVLTGETDVEEFKDIVMRYGAEIIKDDYTYFKAIYAVVPIETLNYVIHLPNVSRVIYGYMYLDKSGIIDYLNMEHPPLGKYFIILSMLTCGDVPLCWRIPSIISGNIILVATFLLMVMALRGRGWVAYLFATLTALSLSFDPMLINSSSLAMLDVFVSLFTVLALLAVMLGKGKLGGLLTGLAGSIKFSGFFNVIPLYLSLRRLGRNPANSILHSIYVPLMVFFILSAPLIAYLGPWQWFDQGFAGAISWHLKQKHEIGKGPPVANPWDWLVNRNPFVYHLNPNLFAEGKFLILFNYLPTAVLTLIALPSILRRPKLRTVIEWCWIPYLMYVLQYLLGGKTQYSFYTIHICPLLHSSAFIALSLITNPRTFEEVLNEWYKLLKLVWDWLGGDVEVKLVITPRSA